MKRSIGDRSISVVLAGGYAPGGTVTFTLRAPDGSTTAQVVTVGGAGTCSAAPAAATQAGTYSWSASYSGDGNNLPAIAADATPIFLVSTMAIHTQNVLADPRSSLLVMQSGGDGDPLGSPRATLLGTVTRID